MNGFNDFGFRHTPINAKDPCACCARCGAPVAPTAVHCRRCWGTYARPKTPDAVMTVGAWRTDVDGVTVRVIKGD